MTSWTWWAPKARPRPADSRRSRSTPSASSRVFQPSVGRRTASDCSFSSPAAVTNAPCDPPWSCQPVPVPGGQRDQPRLAAARAFQPQPGAALRIERKRGDEFGVGGGTTDEVQQIGRAGRRGEAGRGALRGRRGASDTGTVLGDRERGAAGPRGGKRINRTDDTRRPHSGAGPDGPSARGEAGRCQSRSAVKHEPDGEVNHTGCGPGRLAHGARRQRHEGRGGA